MTEISIYALFDKRHPNNYRYIGKSNKPLKRFYQHISEARRNSGINRRKEQWISKVYSEGSEIDIFIIKTVPEKSWKVWERLYIIFFKSRGHDLLNLSKGGDGFECGNLNPMFGKDMSGENNPSYGHRISAENMSRIKAANSNKWSRERREQRSKMFSGNSNPFYGKEHSAEMKAAKSKAYSIPVVQLNSNLTLVRRFSSTKEAKEFIKQPIHRSLKNNNVFVKGYIWMYESQFKSLQL